MERIKYTCANCGWETSVVAQWKDLKPKRCMNKKCNTSFRANPESLITKDPTKVEKSSSSKKKDEDNEKKSASRKQKPSSKVEQQQEEIKDSE